MVLYELLTGLRPYAVTGNSPAAIENAVCRAQPRLASKAAREASTRGETRVYGEIDGRRLERRLAGDLDDVLRMALEKEPERRYPTVDQLAADLERHLGTIGATYRKLGLYREAQPLLERSVTLTSQRYRSRDPAVAAAGQRLADLYFALDEYEYEAAERLTREALALRREQLGEAHAATLESLFRLAQVRHSLGAFSEADELFSRAVRQRGRRATTSC